MLALTRAEYPYVIFVSKNARVKSELSELEEMAEDSKKSIRYDFKVNKNKTTRRCSIALAFLKQVFNPKSEHEKVSKK
jgi:hypothetical protein